MALSYVGGVIGVNGAAVNLAALTGGSNSSPSAGDIVIVVFSSATGTIETLSISTGGYTQLATQLNADDTKNVAVSAYYKIMSGTPDTSVQPVSSNGSYACVVHVWRGVNQSTPIDTTTLTATGIDSSSANSPSIQPVTSGAIVLTAGASVDANSTIVVSTTPTGYGNMRERSRPGDNSSTTCCVIASKAWSGSGAEDPAAWTFTFSGTSDCWGAFSIVLRPEIILGPANLKTYNTNVKANIKTINTNPIANVKSLNTNV